MTHTSLPGGPVQQISDDAITLPYFFVSAGLETLFLNEFLLGKNHGGRLYGATCMLPAVNG
jgi:hypothetical protein